ncbi:drug/metabolite transporter (DMT)-like permease [Dyadobacter sp. BE34]|uniref:Drug/metabolite transporter (DMT)-like permease n=1 Tax=Dyadobacter fermentans TaxID=94254 RepID=A0ABU1R684_9BACT|nr:MULTISPECIES: DMT family transporter [Dyadobacter]MDR6808926.1 drug/metabolite transporter (DMT)-like permease [Dyadobacter fermentans]MDR7046669.1 drug/metabolite transporter (DMT)-like permease [Dyadobacter sp. BE242]MDR7200983.1 drug/metabolite transporter (DMT)-like permease [Dyadobacter sp. BE34]MDR7218943.1 drug/metabolite transporter (DMT)-like permease [Dyadobacter sp. BE31]MDR7264847.1 drug/metabolite transporter (DMT)-like permease [Dyadobacter sp. BE32]
MKQAFIKLHIAIILAGFTGIFGKLITVNEGLLSWYRIWLAGILMLLILAATQKLERISFGDFIRTSLTGLLLGLHWIFFYGSIKYSNISVGVVCFSLVGFFTAIFSPLINRRRFVLSELLLSLLTLMGIALIFSFDSRYRLGIALGVVSSGLGSLFTINNERLAHSFKSETATVYALIGGAIALTPLMPLYFYFFPVTTLVPSWADLAYLLLLAFFCTVVLYMLQTQVLRRISAFTVNLSLNLEPVYTIILAILIYHENKELLWSFYLGLGLIILSVVLQMLQVMRAHRNASPVVAESH